MSFRITRVTCAVKDKNMVLCKHCTEKFSLDEVKLKWKSSGEKRMRQSGDEFRTCKCEIICH